MGSGCPKCGRLFCNTEMGVLEKLKENFPNLEYQKTFDFLKIKNVPQRIDFYLPDYKIGVEYQGQQHFNPVTIFGGEEGFIKNQERDIRKFNKCAEHGIKIYYISFEKNLPQEYMAPIFTNIDDLINEIKKQPIHIKESELKKIITESIKKYLND